MKFLYLVFCFLIISCDLTNEADVDCNGVSSGSASIDDCGVCSGGNTDLIPNSNKTNCGSGGPDSCFNSTCFEEQCNDNSAINYHEVDSEEFINNDLCIYDICSDYIQTNDDYDCNLEVSAPYDINNELGCDALEAELSMCYPENCDNTFKIADFEDKIIWIIYEADWWTACYSGTPQLEEVIIEYLDNPNVAIINVLDDPPTPPYNCLQWGENGDDRIPIIVDNVTTLVGPGELIDVIVTERGIAINPKRQDLIKATKNSGLQIRKIEDIKREIDNLVGAPLEKPDFTKEVVGVIKWVDGTVLDSIFKVK